MFPDFNYALILDVQVFMIRVCIFCLLFLISYAKLPISYDLEDYCDYFILLNESYLLPV